MFLQHFKCVCVCVTMGLARLPLPICKSDISSSVTACLFWQQSGSSNRSLQQQVKGWLGVPTTHIHKVHKNSPNQKRSKQVSQRWPLLSDCTLDCFVCFVFCTFFLKMTIHVIRLFSEPRHCQAIIQVSTERKIQKPYKITLHMHTTVRGGTTQPRRACTRTAWSFARVLSFKIPLFYNLKLFLFSSLFFTLYKQFR